MKTTQEPKFAYGTITRLLQHACNGRRDQILFLQEGRKESLRVTYGQWERDVLAAAGKLQDMEAKHIGVVCDLTYDCIVCLFAAVVSGKVLVTLEADLTADAMERFIKKADIDLILYHEERVDCEITWCEAVEIPDFLAAPGRALADWPAWEKDREAFIFFTSGTEGEPNGVVLTQQNLSFVYSYNHVRILDRNPRVLLFLPVHHVFSFEVLVSCIHDGCEIHLSRSIKYLSMEMERIKPDALMTVPMVNELFRQKVAKGIAESGMESKIAGLIRLSNTLRKIGIDLRTPLFQKLRDSLGGIPQLLITGGSASAEDTIKYFDDIGIIIAQGYGMTETSGPVSANMITNNRIGSVGQPLWFTELRIKDSEIQVRGAVIMKEYYKDPTATARAFDGDWFRTGDLGYLDEDGYLHITGRKKNLIILDSGENVSPEELEKQLLLSPWISEVVVGERGKRIHAQIIPAPAEDMPEQQLKEAIDQAVNSLNRQNPAYKRIVSWELRTEPFEKTSSLKIRR